MINFGTFSRIAFFFDVYKATIPKISPIITGIKAILSMKNEPKKANTAAILPKMILNVLMVIYFGFNVNQFARPDAFVNCNIPLPIGIVNSAFTGTLFVSAVIHKVADFKKSPLVMICSL